MIGEWPADEERRRLMLQSTGRVYSYTRLSGCNKVVAIQAIKSNICADVKTMLDLPSPEMGSAGIIIHGLYPKAHRVVDVRSARKRENLSCGGGDIYSATLFIRDLKIINP